MGADHGPPQLPAVASVRQLAATVMPSLWQYFSSGRLGGYVGTRLY